MDDMGNSRMSREDVEEISVSVGNAIRSLYLLILTVNGDTQACTCIDQNPELRHLSDFRSFDRFCDRLVANIHPEDREIFRGFINDDLLPDELEREVHVSCQCRIRHADGLYYWSEVIFCHATAVDCTDGHDYLFLIRDIHRWKTRELGIEAEQRAIFRELQEKYEDLLEENMRDEQTGCYNRKGMKYYTDIVLEEARKTGKHLFVCVADLNGLKHLNDTWGHAAGDEAIAAVSAELFKAAPTGSRIVRTGGDEFLLMGAVSADSEEPAQLGDKLDAGMAAYNAIHDNAYKIGVSYGWVLLPVREGMVSLDEYIALADARMYEMKFQRDEFRRE